MNKPHLQGCPNIDCHNNKDCCPFRKIVIPSVMGGDSEGEDYAPENGAYRNALVEYESNGHIYMYSSDGIPTRLTGESGASDYEALTNKPSINGHELVGNKTAEELGITSPEPLYVYCLDTYDGQEPGAGVYIYKDASRTVPMTVGEILEAYRNGNSIIFAASAPSTPSPDEYELYVYNELAHVSVTYANGTSQPVTRVRFYIMNNRAWADIPRQLSQTCWMATSISDTWMRSTSDVAQRELTAGEGITISGDVISATGGGGGGATMFYADLQNVHMNLDIYTDSSQSDNVDDAAMIAALSHGPVMIKDMNDNNIYVTVVSANGSSGPLNIVIDMYDDLGDPARRRFEYSGPDWSENPFN